MHFGFSYVGLIYLVLLFIPNIIWTKHRPKDYEEYVKKESRFLLFMERAGEILVTATAVFFSDFNLRMWTAWCWWLVVSFLLMILYEIYWIRYFRSGQTMKDFYSRLLFFRVAGATLPVAAFFLLGIYGSNILMILSSLILGIGHIGIHLAHEKEIYGARKKPPFPLRFGKGILITALVLFFGILSTGIAIRNVRYFNHYGNLFEGVDEQVYLSLGGEEQYVLMTGKNVKNPVIIYLHGGPASPDTFCTYTFADYLTDDYTFICWDQRGCGRTYYKNEAADPQNVTATYEQALTDLDELVDYALQRFGQQKVILMGHSYGTILGSRYAQAYPEKVSALVSVAQVTSLEKTDLYSYRDALARAQEAGEDTRDLEKAYIAFCAEKSGKNQMALRKETAKYHPVRVRDNAIWMSATSPYFGMDDLKWFLVQLGDLNEYYKLNRQLFDETLDFDIYRMDNHYQMPVYFISGTDDWICPLDSVEEYMDSISAPEKSLVRFTGCGHNVQYSKPEQFAETVKEILK
ncbi:MAG: alpha/beta hydrolase [Eubacterium sp.]|nr:alpha/beta hydrolase [Eubacterium sp.]